MIPASVVALGAAALVVIHVLGLRNEAKLSQRVLWIIMGSVALALALKRMYMG